jgi:hypothetical protein
MNWLTKYWNQRHEVAKRLGWHTDLDYYIYRSASKIPIRAPGSWARR